jgi:hypothetical protein
LTKTKAILTCLGCRRIYRFKCDLKRHEDKCIIRQKSRKKATIEKKLKIQVEAAAQESTAEDHLNVLDNK